MICWETKYQLMMHGSGCLLSYHIPHVHLLIQMATDIQYIIVHCLLQSQTCLFFLVSVISFCYVILHVDLSYLHASLFDICLAVTSTLARKISSQTQTNGMSERQIVTNLNGHYANVRLDLSLLLSSGIQCASLYQE